MHETKSRPLIFGEVLYDCFPDGSTVLGGAPFNVAWHLQALGQRPLFISRVGDDEQGEKIRNRMQRFGMDTTALQVDHDHPTGQVQVSFEGNEPRYEIVTGRAYDFIQADQLPDVEHAALLYHGSLALRNRDSRMAFETLKSSYPVPLFMDVNLRPPWWERADVVLWLRDVTWLKLNQDELAALVPQESDLHAQAAYILDHFHPQCLFITRGEHGAIVFSQPGEPTYSVRPRAVNIVDTVGAGDAFSSVLLLGQLLDWGLPLTLERAQSFASAVVGQRGATTEDRNFYQPFIQDWELDRL